MRVLLVAQPRVLGFLFNPVSFWLIVDQTDDLRAVIAEVNNTYGQRHSYLCAHDDLRPIRFSDTLTTKKVFYVSPFQDVSGRYDFRFDYQPGILVSGLISGTATRGWSPHSRAHGARLTTPDILWSVRQTSLRIAAGAGADLLSGDGAARKGCANATAATAARTRSHAMILPRYSVYAAFLAAAGIPIYIHAPKFFADQYGVSLGAIGLALVGLRLLDVVQDPLLGRFAGRLQAGRRLAALVGSRGPVSGNVRLVCGDTADSSTLVDGALPDQFCSRVLVSYDIVLFPRCRSGTRVGRTRACPFGGLARIRGVDRGFDCSSRALPGEPLHRMGAVRRVHHSFHRAGRSPQALQCTLPGPGRGRPKTQAQIGVGFLPILKSGVYLSWPCSMPPRSQ